MAGVDGCGWCVSEVGLAQLRSVALCVAVLLISRCKPLLCGGWDDD